MLAQRKKVVAMRSRFLITCIVTLGMPLAALAEEPSTEKIVCSLDPTCAKQPTMSPPGSVKRRGLTVTGSAPASSTPLAIDLNIPFEYNSAVLQSDAHITLDNLGRAMT